MDEISGKHVAENSSLGPTRSTACVSPILSINLIISKRGAYQTCESVRFAMLVLKLDSFAESADSEVGSDDAKKSHAALIILFIDHYIELYT